MEEYDDDSPVSCTKKMSGLSGLAKKFSHMIDSDSSDEADQDFKFKSALAGSQEKLRGRERFFTASTKSGSGNDED